MKKCLVDGCSNNLWSKGLCKFHSPKTSINKVSKKQVVKNVEKAKLLDKQKQLFELHWKSKPHNCQVCELKLGSENLSIYHDHILEKSKFPELRFELENLILVCFSCHQKKTNGFPEPKHQEFINKAKLKFLK